MEQQFYQVLPIASLVTDDFGFVATGFIQPLVILSIVIFYKGLDKTCRHKPEIICD